MMKKDTSLELVSLTSQFISLINVDGTKSNEESKDDHDKKSKPKKQVAAKDADFEPEDGIKGGKSKKGRKSKVKSPSASPKSSSRKSVSKSGKRSASKHASD